MVQKPDPRKTGMFVLAGLLIFFASLLMINKDRLFSHSIKYVLYFQGSIKGLNVGSPVVFNGVPIGRVVRISLITDVETTEIHIPVYIETNENSFILKSAKKPHKDDVREFTDKMIAKGLRAKLENQSLLTGQMMIGLSYYPDTPVNLHNHNSKIIEIPTLPSIGESFLQTVQKLPLRDMVMDMNALLKEADKLVKSINRDAPDVMRDVSALTHSLSQVAKKTETALESFDADSRTMLDLNKMLRDFSAAA
ncbi:MAG TPA: hypothetical protein DCX19_04485, partial [Alphaproteobacteria bacterium]|nr:hypothetical protein [Alphaproteobacteria bacterium]